MYQQVNPSSNKARCCCNICLLPGKLYTWLTSFTQKGRNLQGVTPSPRDKVPLRKRLASHFDIFERSVIRRTALGVFVRGMQQLSGIDGVLYVRISSGSRLVPEMLTKKGKVCSRAIPASRFLCCIRFFPCIWSLRSFDATYNHSCFSMFWSMGPVGISVFTIPLAQNASMLIPIRQQANFNAMGWPWTFHLYASYRIAVRYEECPRSDRRW